MNPYELLRAQLIDAIKPISGSPDEVIDIVLRTLEQQRIVSFSKGTDQKLLSSAGRVFVAVLENPGMTQRALGKYLGMQEPQVHKLLKDLTQANLLTVETVGRTKTFKAVGEDVLRHPDVSRFFDVIVNILNEKVA